jgi:hypothetical protein
MRIYLYLYGFRRKVGALLLWWRVSRLPQEFSVCTCTIFKGVLRWMPVSVLHKQIRGVDNKNIVGASLILSRCFDDQRTTLTLKSWIGNILQWMFWRPWFRSFLCNLHVTLISKITPRYFALFTNGIFRPFRVRLSRLFIPFPVTSCYQRCPLLRHSGKCC